MKKLAVKSVKTFAYGFFPTGFAVLVSFAVAKWGFENMYYMGQFLPAFMFFYLLLAWFIYLRRTSFLAWNLHEGKPVDPLGHYEGHMAWILLWSACQIGVLATILYHWLGIGAVFFKASFF
jgi:Na+/H+-dicarboxylate symporter